MSDSASNPQGKKDPATPQEQLESKTSTASPTDGSTQERANEPQGPSIGETISAALDDVRATLGPSVWSYGVYALVGALILFALFMPPISLLRRIGLTGYTAVSAQEAVSHPDGITLSASDGFEGGLRVRLESIPEAEFLKGSRSAWRDAAQALVDDSPHLEVKSPIYLVKSRGNAGDPVVIDVKVPTGAEPWETLDLYTWTGEAWEWVGGELHTETADEEFIRVELTKPPKNVAVVQAGQVDPRLSTTLSADDDSAAIPSEMDAISPVGLILGLDGRFVGQPSELPLPAGETTATVMPALRNWAPGGSTNQGLLSDVLSMPQVQETHISNIVELCTANGFGGVTVDYRGVLLEEREAYSDFIAALAEALHAEDLTLSVVVEPATPTDGTWSGGGYDWRAIGATADYVKAPLPDDATTYERFMNWATSQVSRYKLLLHTSALSTDRVNGTTTHLPLEKALAPFGEAMAHGGAAEVEQDSQLAFGLSGQVLSITPQSETGSYRLEYQDDEGATHSVWLSTASSLAARLDWANRYHLGGVSVTDLLHPGNVPEMVNAAVNYQTGATTSDQEMQVMWQVTSPGALIDQEALPLTEPEYTWTATVVTGTYEVKATIAGFDHGSLAVTVTDPNAEPEPKTEPDSAADAEPDGEIEIEGESDGGIGGGGRETNTEGSGADCLKAAFAGETVPDGTHFEKGESFTKSWTLKNTGTCDWPEDTALVKVESETGGPDSVPVGALAVGETVDVAVDMEAPDADGSFRSDWVLKADGKDLTSVYALIQAGEASSSPPPVAAPAPSGSFELGAHITNHSLPYADQMRYAGMTWVKEQVRYRGGASGLIAAAHNNGFKIQLSALGSPDMVTKPGFEQDFANWVAEMAAAGADAIEIWNEPNIEREWQIGHISPQAYTNLLCTSYNAIKAANPNTLVISAAPAPTGFFGGCGPNGCDDQPWLQGMYNAGAAQCMDYIGAHHNAGATSPSARVGHPANPSDTHHSWFFLPQTELYYNIFQGTRKIFYTEMGYASQEGLPTFSDQFAWARGINNAQQAAWLAEAVQLGINTGTVRCIIVWNVGRSRAGYDPQDGYNIIRPGGSCPACDSLHNLLGTR